MVDQLGIILLGFCGILVLVGMAAWLLTVPDDDLDDDEDDEDGYCPCTP